jgi:hypothetical protein
MSRTLPTATYATVLPDGITQDMADSNFRDRLYAKGGREGAREGAREPAPAEAPRAEPSKADHKPLIIGLLIIIAILTIVITVQVMQSRNAAATPQQPVQNVDPGPQPPQQTTQYAPSQPAQQLPPQRGRDAVADRIANQTLQKRRLSPAAPTTGRTLGRQMANDRQQLATIAEEAEADAPDQAAEDTRAMINNALRESADEEPLEQGTALVVSADMAAHEDIKRENAPIPVRDERLIDQQTADAEGADAEPVICNSILASGPRTGQVCGRRCQSGQIACAAHKKK